MRYIVGRYYRRKNVEYQAGQIITIDDPEYAAWLKRDMGGYLEPMLDGMRVVERAPEAPPADRMVRKLRRRSAK